MIIVHENLPVEAIAASKVIKDVYGLESLLFDIDLEDEFLPIPEFEGYWASTFTNLREKFGDKAMLVITPRDLYANNTSRNDDWGFGYSYGNLGVVSTARIKRLDSEPSKKIEIPEELYFKRLNLLAIHEIGHDVVEGMHFQPAIWVNTQTNYQNPLGPHCTDNTCSMYEIVDTKTPPASQGHMLLGTEKKFDTGLDELIARLNTKWFCGNCFSSIKLNPSYN